MMRSIKVALHVPKLREKMEKNGVDEMTRSCCSWLWWRKETLCSSI